MTNERATPPKAELIEKLRATGADLVARVRGMDVAALEAGRYENGWNARQILAHVASIEWTYPRLIEMAQAAGGADASAGAAPSGATAAVEAPNAAASSEEPAGVSGSGSIANAATTPVVNSYNDRQVEKRAQASVEELLAEFEKNRAATIAAVEDTDDALLSTPITSSGGARGPLAGVMQFVAVEHVRGHLRDITGRG